MWCSRPCHEPCQRRSRVGPVGLEPTTNGLKVRRTPFPSVSSCRVLRGNSRDSEPAKSRFMSSRAVLFPSRRLQIGLHAWMRIGHRRWTTDLGDVESALVEHDLV